MPFTVKLPKKIIFNKVFTCKVFWQKHFCNKPTIFAKLSPKPDNLDNIFRLLDKISSIFDIIQFLRKCKNNDLSKTYVIGGGGGGRGWVRCGARCAASGRGQAQTQQKYRQPGVGSRYMAQAEQKYRQPGVGSRYRAHRSRITHSPHPASESVIKQLV